MKNLLLLLCTVLLTATGCRSTSPASDAGDGPWLAHDVFFDMQDDSEAAHSAFVQSCWDLLAELDGIRLFACGERDVSRDHPMNDKAYDISLHVLFDSPEAYDAYLVHPKHLELLDKHAAGWKGVQVFDSLVEPRFIRR